jgi:hypothetical protein
MIVECQFECYVTKKTNNLFIADFITGFFSIINIVKRLHLEILVDIRLQYLLTYEILVVFTFGAFGQIR